MKRREFISLVGGAAAWPLSAHAQQSVPVIGFLHPGSPEAFALRSAAFRKGLSEVGYVEGRNVAIEFRFANDQFDRLPELVADLIRHQVAVIAASSQDAAHAAKAATTTIPIVFRTGADPVLAGLVASLNRPAGNVTGIADMNAELVPKRLALLHELLPKAARIGVLVNRTDSTFEAAVTEMQRARRPLGGTSKCSRRPPTARSMRLLQPLCKSGPRPSSSLRAACSIAVASNSLRWQRTTGCPRAITTASLPIAAG
jgi:ABC-type uncharacterized transport system substrate-binding protein